MPEVLHNGNVYIAQPPLYKVTAGRTIQYAYDDKQLKFIVDNLEGDSKRYALQRYKGLGENGILNNFGKTTMNPDTRTFYQVKIDDAREADMIFDKLMGDKVEPRRQFIENGAQFVKNLDI